MDSFSRCLFFFSRSIPGLVTRAVGSSSGRRRRRLLVTSRKRPKNKTALKNGGSEKGRDLRLLGRIRSGRWRGRCRRPATPAEVDLVEGDAGDAAGVRVVRLDGIESKIEAVIWVFFVNNG